MSTTLTNGLKLPDKGSVDWYADMQNNYTILDGAVGTIAEHTSALSGKAPLVHTHTKSDITDFPAYGTTAGTICEGNDSRLSDARTPVAHTHVTSEVLKTGSAFTGGTVTNPYFKIASWEMGANQYFGAVLLVQNPNYPRNQAFVNIEIRTYSNYNFQTGYLYLSNDYGILKDSLCICYKQESNKVLCELYYYDTAAWNGIFFSVLNESLRYGAGAIYLFQTMTVYNQQQADAVANLPAGYTVIQANYMPLFQNVTPGVNNTYDLGTSTNKWKSFNGINPGALSLPDYNNALDVTSEIPVASLDGNTQIDINNYLPNKTGWLSIVIADTAGNFIVATQGRSGGSTAFNNSRTFHTGAQSNGYISVFFPILADMNKFVIIKASSLIQMRLYYCLGNV